MCSLEKDCSTQTLLYSAHQELSLEYHERKFNSVFVLEESIKIAVVH